MVGMEMPVSPETLVAPARGGVAVQDIVDRMQQHEANQLHALKHYDAIRHYGVEYRGFGTTMAGKMDVEVDFDASSGKTFRILSEKGSKFLCENVLKRAVEGEKEASREREATALTPVNYKFQLEKVEELNQRPAYVLDVEPLTVNKFLYRGRIWVDAQDFAVEKIEARPAKNPSLWISKTEIRYTSTKVSGFWLPEQNRSETQVRIGGTAVLTIDYGNYQDVSDSFVPSEGS